MEVLLVAAPKALIEKYMTLLELADLVPLPRKQKLSRQPFTYPFRSQFKNVMVISIGAQTTDMSIYAADLLHLPGQFQPVAMR